MRELALALLALAISACSQAESQQNPAKAPTKGQAMKPKVSTSGYDITPLPTESQLLKTEVAYFAGGCFWGVEHTFKKGPGVLDAVSGQRRLLPREEPVVRSAARDEVIIRWPRPGRL